MNTNLVTILLQGVINPNIDLNKTITEYKQYGKIVLSIYKNEYEYIINNIKHLEDLDIVLNDIDTYDNEILKFPLKSSHYYQLQTTKKGLEKINTEYVIKTRVDHYYSNLNLFIQKCFDTDKIIVLSHYIRGFSQYTYHLSDCLFMGKTIEIKKVVRIHNRLYKIF